MPALNPQQRGAILLLYDVTDLVRLDEMRSELVAVASHELQTPLTTLRMTLLMLQEASDLLPERQRELVATSLIGVEQLTETVHEFLDLTRIEAGELRLNLEPVHVSAVIAEALRRVEGQAKAQGISLSSRVGSGSSADLRPTRSACGPSSTTSCRMRSSTRRPEAPSRSKVRWSIEWIECAGKSVDQHHRHGPGIPPAFRSRIFDKFFRLEHHQTEDRPHARGAGIGLYMCRQIVELHGGHIECAAGADDRGACITVELPAAVARLDSGRLANADSTLLASREGGR